MGGCNAGYGPSRVYYSRHKNEDGGASRHKQNKTVNRSKQQKSKKNKTRKKNLLGGSEHFETDNVVVFWDPIDVALF